MARNIGPFAVPPMGGEAVAGGRRGFPVYTLPAFEVRRLLHEARQRREAFGLTLTQLRGPNATTNWLATGGGRTMTLTEDGRGGRECVVHEAAGETPCAADDVAVAPLPVADFRARPLASLLGWLQTHNSYPIVDRERGDDELHCYGS